MRKLTLRKICMVLILVFVISGTVFAHDGSKHISDLEVWVSGIGILLIIAASVAPRNPKSRKKYTHFIDDDSASEK